MAKKKVKQVTVDEIKVELSKIGINETDEKELVKTILEKTWQEYQKESVFMLYLQAMYVIYKNNPGLSQLIATNQEKLKSTLMYMDYLINRIK